MKIANIRKDLILHTFLAAGLFWSSANAQTLEWTTGQLGGGWYGLGSGLSSLVTENSEINIRVVPGGGRDNPSKIQAGISQIGMGLDFLDFAAVNGMPPYQEEHDKVRSIGKGWGSNPFHFLSVNNTNESIEEVLHTPGVSIGINQAGASDELVFRWVLEYYEMSYEDIRDKGSNIIHGSVSDLIDAYRNGQVDYLFLALGVPAASIIELSQSRRNMYLSSLPEDLIDHLTKSYGLGAANIPMETYGDDVQSDIVRTANMNTELIVSNDIDEDTVYTLTKTLLERTQRFGSIHSSLESFDPSEAWDTAIPLHPGAKKAYEELGYID